MASLGQLLLTQRMCKNTQQVRENVLGMFYTNSVFHRQDRAPRLSVGRHRPVGRSTSWSSFLTNPMLFGVEAAKERKLVKLVHSIPLESKQISVLYLFSHLKCLFEK